MNTCKNFWNIYKCWNLTKLLSCSLQIRINKLFSLYESKINDCMKWIIFVVWWMNRCSAEAESDAFFLSISPFRYRERHEFTSLLLWHCYWNIVYNLRKYWLLLKWLHDTLMMANLDEQICTLYLKVKRYLTITAVE